MTDALKTTDLVCLQRNLYRFGLYHVHMAPFTSDVCRELLLRFLLIFKVL